MFEMMKKKIFGSIFTKKNCHQALKNMGEEPIPDPWSRGQKGTGSRIRIRNIEVTGSTDLELDPAPDPTPTLFFNG